MVAEGEELKEEEEEGEGYDLNGRERALYDYREEEEEDPTKKAEDDFWYTLNQEKQDIEKREKKRQDALIPKHQPTPIPEENPEATTGEGKVTNVS